MLLALNFGFASEFDALFIKYGEIYNIPPKLLWAIAKTESEFNPNLTAKNDNNSTDYGLMQINSINLPTFEKMDYSKNDLFNPEISIKCGAIILRSCLDRWGFNYKAVNCYNGRVSNNNYNVRVLSKLAKNQKTNKNLIIK